jgi:MFS transporter, MHS family, shikimate and dehydroshikimate transport protein
MTSEAQPQGTAIWKVAAASFIGTAVEWYDFFLYGQAAALIFNRLFFPQFDPLVGTLAAFATFAVGFIARPLGGVVFGHFGDKLGRKSMLSATLIIMGAATFTIGLLPTYESIGVWAPLLLVLLRLLQGFGLGGEWGGAVLMAVEHAPAHRRGFYGSWPPMGAPAGLLVATAVLSAFSKLPEEQFMAWGWRVPFLLSAVLILIGVFIRLSVAESPAFEQHKASGPAHRQILGNGPANTARRPGHHRALPCEIHHFSPAAPAAAAPGCAPPPRSPSTPRAHGPARWRDRARPAPGPC